MRTFKDTEGVDWKLSIDMQSAMLIRTEVGIDILDIAEGKDLTQISGDLLVLGAVLWLLVVEQAVTLNLDEKQFFRRLDGDAIEAATVALVAECLDFFPKEKRALLKSAWDKIKNVEAKGVQKAMTLLETTTDEEFEKLVTGYALDLKQRAESLSTPGDTPSAI